MSEDENMATYFLRVGEVVNVRRWLGDKIEECDIVSKFIRFVLPKFETKIFALEEKKNFPKTTLH